MKWPVEKLSREIKARDKAHAREMVSPLNPAPSILCKLGSIVVHADEMLSPQGHQFDKIALQGLIADPEIQAWLDKMTKAAFLPVKRTPSEERQIEILTKKGKPK